MDVFYPASTNAIAATATSQARAFATLTAHESHDSCAFYNDGPSAVFIAMGASTIVATLPGLSAAVGAQGNSTPIPVGSSINLRRGSAETYWAAICPAGLTSNVYCTPGLGL